MGTGLKILKHPAAAPTRTKDDLDASLANIWVYRQSSASPATSDPSPAGKSLVGLALALPQLMKSHSTGPSVERPQSDDPSHGPRLSATCQACQQAYSSHELKEYAQSAPTHADRRVAREALKHSQNPRAKAVKEPQAEPEMKRAKLKMAWLRRHNEPDTPSQTSWVRKRKASTAT